MRFGKRGSGAPPARRRGAYCPGVQGLERRDLLAAIDLANTATNPYGVIMGGLNGGGGTGFSVADVGDVNGDGFDDFVLGAPSVVVANGVPTLATGGNAMAFLVFGSNAVNTGTVDWLTLSTVQRIGDLGQLGNGAQNNPISGAPGFPFNGLTFISSQNPTSGLGASVAAVGDVNGDGFADFMIGAPGSLDLNGTNAGTGRAYLVYGGTNLTTRTNKTVDLDNTGANADLNILTFVNNAPTAATGRAVASAGDFITDGFPDIAIGAPNAAVGGLANAGAAYVVSGTFLRPARSQTINLGTVGQAGGVAGLILTGAAAGDEAGFSIANAGDVNGVRTSANQLVTDLLIGAPQPTTGPGQAYLVYGGLGIGAYAANINGVSAVSLLRVGTPPSPLPNPSPTAIVPGAIFTGINNGDETGFAVSSAGDFNADGLADFLIGSPLNNAAAGRVDMIYGNAATGSTGSITGSFPLNQLPASINSVTMAGASPGALAGFSVGFVGTLNNDAINEILIGSPGFNAGLGGVYIVPGNPGLLGVQSLANIQSQPLQGTIMTLSQPTTPNYLGTSVSGLIGPNGARQTMDSDRISDFVVGAAGFSVVQGRNGAGGGFALEGAFIPVPNVVSSAVTSPIGVGSATPPFSINATSPADLTIFILSKGASVAGFSPFTDIDPNTIKVNGVALPNPGSWTDAGDLDGDGIDDASFIFSPRSLLGLTAGTTTITVSARTTATATAPNQPYTGSASVTVTGGGGGGGNGGIPSSRNQPLFFGFPIFQPAVPPFGSALLPAQYTLGKLRWKPLPVPLAYNQFFPSPTFQGRERSTYHDVNAQHPPWRMNPKTEQEFISNQPVFGNSQVYTLPKSVFTRSKYKPHQSRYQAPIPSIQPTIPTTLGNSSGTRTQSVPPIVLPSNGKTLDKGWQKVFNNGFKVGGGDPRSNDRVRHQSTNGSYVALPTVRSANHYYSTSTGG